MNTSRAVLHNYQQAVVDIQCLSQNLQPLQTSGNSKEKCSMYHWLLYFESQRAYHWLIQIEQGKKEKLIFHTVLSYLIPLNKQT
ncbi:hypothetical protein C0J52_07505 [Blattella germanica]|nr:hypothetical protein C0J52_07505 [Blattella germanica]